MRISWIDIAKGIAIITVIIAHTGFLPFSSMTGPLTAWMLPIFPFIGGYLFKDTQTSIQSYAIKKSQQLLLPYIIAGVMSFLGWLYLRNYYPQDILLFPITETALQLILAQGLIFNGPLWFLPCYFLASLAFKLIYPLWHSCQKDLQVVILVVLSVIAAMVVSLTINLPYALDISLLFLSLFLAGNYYKEQKLNFNRWVLLLLLIIFLLASLVNTTTDLHQRLLHNPSLYLMSIYTGIVLIISLSQWLEKQKTILKDFFIYIGRNSLLLLVIHWPIMQWLSYLLTVSGVRNRIGANPTITSFWLPATLPFIHIYIILLLIFYISVIVIITLVITTITKRYLAPVTT